MNVFLGLINGMITSATPILLAALGGSLTYYAGIFNIAMEGMMLSGAFFGMLGSYYFHSWPMAFYSPFSAPSLWRWFHSVCGGAEDG